MKKLIACLVVVLLLLAGAYSGAWFYAKDRLDDEITRIFADAGKNNITFMGEKPVVTGFPGAPTIHYHEGIRVRNWQLSFTDMIVSCYPLPGMPVHIEFPGGVIAWMDEASDSIALQQLDATIRIPKPVPRSTTQDDMRAWRDAGGKVEIIDTLAVYDATRLNMNGVLALNDDMQINADLNVQSRGHGAMLQKLIDEKTIKPFVGFALLAALNNFTLPDPDPETGEAIAQLPVRINDQSVYVGPVLVGALPALVWDTRNPPALRQ